jgi:glutathione S-transferase
MENVRGPFMGYIFNKYFRPKFFGGKFSQDVNDLSFRMQGETLEFLDEMLGKSEFIAGMDTVSIADLACYCELSQMRIEGAEFGRYKNLEKWINRMKEMKGIKVAHAAFEKILPRIKL